AVVWQTQDAEVLTLCEVGLTPVEAGIDHDRLPHERGLSAAPHGEHLARAVRPENHALLESAGIGAGAAPYPHVAMVERGRLEPPPGLARPRHGICHVLELEVLGRPRLSQDRCLHARRPVQRCGAPRGSAAPERPRSPAWVHAAVRPHGPGAPGNTSRWPAGCPERSRSRRVRAFRGWLARACGRPPARRPTAPRRASAPPSGWPRWRRARPA